MNVKSLFSVAAFAALSAAGIGAQAAQVDEYALNQNLPTTSVAGAARIAQHVAASDEYQRNQIAAATEQPADRAQVRAEARQARKLGHVAEGELAS